MSQFDIPEGSHDLVVGGRGVRWWDAPLECNHADRNVCPACAELTEAEVAAVRAYLGQVSIPATTSVVQDEQTNQA